MSIDNKFLVSIHELRNWDAKVRITLECNEKPFLYKMQNVSFDLYQWIQSDLSHTYFLLLLSWTYSVLLVEWIELRKRKIRLVLSFKFKIKIFFRVCPDPGWSNRAGFGRDRTWVHPARARVDARAFTKIPRRRNEEHHQREKDPGK